MREHVQAVVDAAAADLAWPVEFGTADQDALPWVLVEAGYAGDLEDLPLCGERSDVDMEVRVKAVAGTYSGALQVRDETKAALTPRDRPEPLTVAGRRAWITHTRHETDYVDRDVAMAGGVHPCVSVDTYQVQSVPA